MIKLAKEKRPEIDETIREVILSRIFGDSYAKSPKFDNYVGYMDGIPCEISFCNYLFFLDQLGNEKELTDTKFANRAMGKLFVKKGLSCHTDERIDFDDTLCVSVMQSDTSVLFHFWYRK